MGRLIVAHKTHPKTMSPQVLPWVAGHEDAPHNHRAKVLTKVPGERASEVETYAMVLFIWQGSFHVSKHAFSNTCTCTGLGCI